MALRLVAQTSVMSRSTSGLKSHISGWCGSKKKTGGAPMISVLWGGRRRSVADGLREHARVQGHPRRGRVVAVVGIVERVGEDDVRLGRAVDGDQLVGQFGGVEQRVVAGVEEDDLGAEGGGGGSRPPRGGSP